MPFLAGRIRIAAALLAVLAASGRPAGMVASGLTEAQEKAALLYNLSGFVEWPRESTRGTIVIGVAGDADVLVALRPVSGRVLNGRVVAVRDLRAAADSSRCQVLYLPAMREHASGWPPRRVGHAGVLTVGDAPTFTRDGGIVRIFFEGDRLRFDVDLVNADRARLRISSKVLELARRVRREGRDD